MFDSDFKETWRKQREELWEKSDPKFKKNVRGYVSMLKNEWSNFETEMMASTYSLLYLSEIASDVLRISENDLSDPAKLSSAALLLADFMSEDNKKFHSYSRETDADYPVNELVEPFQTIIKTFICNVDYMEIAKAFLENEA